MDAHARAERDTDRAARLSARATALRSEPFQFGLARKSIGTTRGNVRGDAPCRFPPTDDLRWAPELRRTPPAAYPAVRSHLERGRARRSPWLQRRMRASAHAPRPM